MSSKKSLFAENLLCNVEKISVNEKQDKKEN